MTGKQKYDANEQKAELLMIAGNRCVVCGAHISPTDVWDLGHRILKSKSMIDKLGREVIFHPMNMLPACNGTRAGRSCNDRCNLRGQKVAADELARHIIRVNTGLEPMPDMREYYANLREEFSMRWES